MLQLQPPVWTSILVCLLTVVGAGCGNRSLQADDGLSPDAGPRADLAVPPDARNAPDGAATDQAAPPPAWAFSAGGVGFDVARDVAIDGQDNIFAVGQFTGAALLGATTLVAGSDKGAYAGYVAKLTPNGALLWAKPMGRIVEGVAAVDSGGAYVVGTFDDKTATLGGVTLTSAGSHDGFVARIDAAGKVLWAVRVGGALDDRVDQVGTDSAGDLYLQGSFANQATIGAAPVLTAEPPPKPSWASASDAGAATPLRNFFVAKLSSTGGLRWVAKYSGVKSRGFAVYPLGGSVVTGTFYLPGRFGTIVVDPKNHEMYAARLDTNGTFQWVARTSAGQSNAHSSGEAVATDGAGRTYVAGTFSATTSFGAITLSAAGTEDDIFVARLDSKGTFDKVVRAGGSRDEIPHDIALDSSGAICLTGHHDGTKAEPSIFGSTSLVSPWQGDAFVTRLDMAKGAFLWTRASASAATVEGRGVAADRWGGCVVVGYFGGLVPFPTIFGKAKVASKGMYDLFVWRAL